MPQIKKGKQRIRYKTKRLPAKKGKNELRNGVIRPLPGIERLTAANPFECQPATAQSAVSADRLNRILGACRYVPAACGKEGRNFPLIEADGRQEEPFH